ncbi:MAG: co-chaperone GroES [Desulfuromonadaceae bacterium]
MNIKPLHDRIIVKCVEEETKTAAGIIIPDTASKEKPQQGVVLAVGPGKLNTEGKVLPMSVKTDDKVLFGKYAGTDIKVDGVDYLMLREEDVLGIIE